MPSGLPLYPGPEAVLSAASRQFSGNPRYEPHENPSLAASLGFAGQFSVVAAVTLLATPVVVAQASGRGDSYLVWMVFASLLVAGISTLVQVRRVGPVGAGALLPMFTAAFSIPFCISAVVDGGPATLTALVMVCAVGQIIIPKWLFVLRHIVTPTVGGTVLMILSITLAWVVPRLLPEASEAGVVGAHLTALATLGVVAALILRGSAALRLWGPVVGIIVGCAVAAVFGLYDTGRIIEAPWVGLPSQWPGLGLDLGVPFWTLLPAFLFLSVIISIQANGESIAQQRASRRPDQYGGRRAVDFRQVQGALTGTGAANLIAGVAGTVPHIINPAPFPILGPPASLPSGSDTSSAPCSSS